MADTRLTGKNGPIWPSRPTVTSTGLLSVIWNRRHRPSAVTAPLFRDVAFSPVGLAAASVDARGHLIHYNFLQNRYYHVKHVGGGGVRIVFHPHKGDEVFVSLEDGTVRCYCLTNGELLGMLGGHKHPVTSLSFDATGRLLLTSSVDGAMIWSLADWSRIRTMGAGTGIVQACYLPGSTDVACAFRDNSVVVWDSASFDVKARFTVPDKPSSCVLECVAGSGDGQFIAAGTRTGAVLLWDVVTQALVRIVDMPLPAQVVSQLRFLPDHVTLAALCDDGHILLLTATAQSCKAVLDISAPDKVLLRFGIDPTGRYLASVVSDGKLMIHDMEAARKHRRRVQSTQALNPFFPVFTDKSSGSDGGAVGREPRFKKPDVPRSGVKPKSASKSPTPTPSHTHTSTKPTHPRRSKRAVERSLISDDEGDGVDDDNTWSSDDGSKSTDTSDVEKGDGIRTRVCRVDTVASSMIEKAFPPRHPSSHRTVTQTTAKHDIGPQHIAKPMSREIIGGSVPLYRLSNLNKHDIAVNDERLMSLLSERGKYPSKYRCLIWRFLLRLPENHHAYSELVRKGLHPSVATLHIKYPLKDSRLLKRLRSCLSALAHWSPVLGELEFLPELAFPFVKLFEGDGLGAVESVMTMLLNWCGNWAEMFPYPPLSELGRVRVLLELHDPQLCDHLLACGAGPDVFAWPLLRTAFSEVLSRAEWCELWDNLIANASDSSLFLFAVVAYLTTLRIALFAIVPSVKGSDDTSSRDEIQEFLRHQNPINVTNMIKTMYALRKATPSHYLSHGAATDTIPGSSLGSRVFGSGGISNFPGDMPVGSDADVAACRAAGPGPAYMLPVGQYPPFTRFPKFVVDYQLQERARIEMEEQAVLSKRRLAQVVTQRNAELEQQERAWKEESELLLAAEEARAKAARELELSHKRSIEGLMHEGREQRLQQLSALQQAAKDATTARRNLVTAQRTRETDTGRQWSESMDRLASYNAEDDKLLELETQAGNAVLQSQLGRLEAQGKSVIDSEDAIRRQADEFARSMAEEEARTRHDLVTLQQHIDAQRYGGLEHSASVLACRKSRGSGLSVDDGHGDGMGLRHEAVDVQSHVTRHNLQSPHTQRVTEVPQSTPQQVPTSRLATATMQTAQQRQYQPQPQQQQRDTASVPTVTIPRSLPPNPFQQTTTTTSTQYGGGDGNSGKQRITPTVTRDSGIIPTFQPPVQLSSMPESREITTQQQDTTQQRSRQDIGGTTTIPRPTTTSTVTSQTIPLTVSSVSTYTRDTPLNVRSTHSQATFPGETGDWGNRVTTVTSALSQFTATSHVTDTTIPGLSGGLGQTRPIPSVTTTSTMTSPTIPRPPVSLPTFQDLLADEYKYDGQDRTPAQTGTVQSWPTRVRVDRDDFGPQFPSSAPRSRDGGDGYRHTSTSSFSGDVSGSGYWTTDDTSGTVDVDRLASQRFEGVRGRQPSNRPISSGSSHSYDVSGSGSWYTDVSREHGPRT